MPMSDLVAYVEHLPFDVNSSAVPVVVPLRIRRSTTDNDNGNGPEMIGDMIAIYDPSLSAENKAAAVTCILFAELATNQQLSNDDSLEYLDTFYSVLNNIGWYTLSSSSGSQASTGETQSFGSEFLNIIKSLIERNILRSDYGDRLMKDLDDVCTALEADVPTFWGESDKKLDRTEFEVAFVSQTADGSSPIITFNAFSVDVKLSGWTVFGVKQRREAYDIKSQLRKMTLNAILYSRIKSALEARLYGMSVDYILKIDIGTVRLTRPGAVSTDSNNL